MFKDSNAFHIGKPRRSFPYWAWQLTMFVLFLGGLLSAFLWMLQAPRGH